MTGMVARSSSSGERSGEEDSDDGSDASEGGRHADREKTRTRTSRRRRTRRTRRRRRHQSVGGVLSRATKMGMMRATGREGRQYSFHSTTGQVVRRRTTRTIPGERRLTIARMAAMTAFPTLGTTRCRAKTFAKR